MPKPENCIHAPKLRTFDLDKRSANNPTELKIISPNITLVINIWNEIDSIWKINGVITRDKGYKWVTKLEESKNYTVEKILDKDGNFVGFYCDITSPVKLKENGYEFYDWYLDVFQPVDGKPEILDEDEFDQAVKAGYLTEAEILIARKALNQLLAMLEVNLFDRSNSTNL